ncbi:NAD(P)-dependent oxidoreductase [Jatrophihabitans sp. DSM 45814]
MTASGSSQASTPSLSIALIGATGNIGSKVLAEALQRGHQVTGIVRDTSKLPVSAQLTPHAADTHDVTGLTAALNDHDVAIVSVRWNSNQIEDVLEAVRSSTAKRVIIVIGAGSLIMTDGRLLFDYNTERGLVAPTSGAALDAYRKIVQVSDISWTAVSPALKIEPGERTGVFRIGGDQLLVDDPADSRISQEDFAVAIIDEAEDPKHVRSRFSVAY